MKGLYMRTFKLSDIRAIQTREELTLAVQFLRDVFNKLTLGEQTAFQAVMLETAKRLSNG
jgi:hypothetical protein